MTVTVVEVSKAVTGSRNTDTTISLSAEAPKYDRDFPKPLSQLQVRGGDQVVMPVYSELVKLI